MMADFSNKRILVTSMDACPVTTSVQLDSRPLCFARLSDGRVALTATSKTLFILSDNGDVTVRSSDRTAKDYRGVAEGPGGDTLIVSRWNEHGGTAGVDIVRRNGHLVKTIRNDESATLLDSPMHLCVMDGHVLIPELNYSTVLRVEVTTGRVMDTLTHPDLKAPHQVVVDGQRNMYVTSRDGQCVLVQSASGQWRKLLHGPQHSVMGYVYPVRLCLTKAGLAVTWWTDKTCKASHVVVVYNFT